MDSLARQCSNGVCHCDWRIEIQNCEEEEGLYYISIINIAIAGLGGLLGMILLVYRLFIQGHTIWNHGSNGAFLKPKPVDSMILFFVIHSILHLLQSVFLMLDIARNYAFRSFFFEFGFEFAYGGVTLYLIGIAQTISQSRNVSGWLPSPRIVDIVGGIFLFSPFVVNTWFAISAGLLAESSVQTARILARVHYAAWTVECGGLGGAILYAGVRLVRILQGHHNNFRRRGHFAAVQAGIFKIQLIVAAFVIAVWGFALICLFYFALREEIINNTIGSLFMGAAWWNLAGVTIIFAQLVVVMSPKITSNAALRSKSTGNSNSGLDEENSVTVERTNNGSTLGGTTNNTYFDESDNGAGNLKSNNDKQWVIQERQWQAPNPLNPPSYMQKRPRDGDSPYSPIELGSYKN
ncbi:hypothetical protein BDA99DRAFT_21345 [Phascolomyces articulosus]|uniref:Uncharacterized protein n=1 Tax=Phascolomyces articulosus TaxID=60185 RepID=A0AAD5KS03_9FUNG|nr:hypothetical protein BDA99DRAFT_21345 [Phascolomyces articulosus]